MNYHLMRHTWRTERVKLSVASTALFVWGFLLPLVYARYGSQFKAILDSGLLPAEFSKLGGGDVFSLPGAIALGFIHPIPMILISIFAVGFSASAVAGERQRGTLEVVLARPISRRRLYVTLLASAFGFVAVAITALLAGGIAGSFYSGVAGELAIARLPLVWLNAVLLFGALASIGLAASVSVDRGSVSLGITLGVVLVMYFFEIIGSLWPEAEVLQPFSLFHYLQPKVILTEAAAPFDFLILTATITLAIAWTLQVFPRRDLPAPS
jgi:ABC-2 type transport system permease protein